MPSLPTSTSRTAEVGYESGAAFHRAFKKAVGTAPGAWKEAEGDLIVGLILLGVAALPIADHLIANGKEPLASNDRNRRSVPELSRLRALLRTLGGDVLADPIDAAAECLDDAARVLGNRAGTLGNLAG